ncbi:hypothetical protein [Bacillus pinisoli]|uniref:hypothetical protein n=1 Tax=Bacillus pinisoli TaxID=2901866 RepID=UPI001FF37F08|nr:hypothetical protein [Bacillus pinisoli]
MFNVHFFENRNLLLNQARKLIPAEGEALTIKGRKGKVTSVTKVDDTKIYVEVSLDPILKNKQMEIDSKKKKR